VTDGWRWAARGLLVLFVVHVAAAVAVAVDGADEHAAGATGVGVVVVVGGVTLAWRPIRAAGSRAAAAVATPDELREPPSDQHPAVVALLVHGRTAGLRMAVAATVLALVERRQLRLEPLDAQRFELSVVPLARGGVPIEWYVLQALRGGASREQGRTLTGPPLFREEMWRAPRLGTFERDLRQMATNSKLLAPVLSGVVLFVVPIALGACLVGFDSVAAVAVRTWGFSFGPVVGIVASALLGVHRTAAGEVESARWEAHGRWLARNANFDDLDVPAITIWGEHLTRAVATGVAPRAARALSPDL
jgi:hypothetical protein